MGEQCCFRHYLWLGLDELGRMLAIVLASPAPTIAYAASLAVVGRCRGSAGLLHMHRGPVRQLEL